MLTHPWTTDGQQAYILWWSEECVSCCGRKEWRSSSRELLRNSPEGNFQCLFYLNFSVAQLRATHSHKAREAPIVYRQGPPGNSQAGQQSSWRRIRIFPTKHKNKHPLFAESHQRSAAVILPVILSPPPQDRRKTPYDYLQWEMGNYAKCYFRMVLGPVSALAQRDPTGWSPGVKGFARRSQWMNGREHQGWALRPFGEIPTNAVHSTVWCSSTG